MTTQLTNWWMCLAVVVGICCCSSGSEDAGGSLGSGALAAATPPTEGELLCMQEQGGAACAEYACAQLNCGGVDSIYDENGCLRKECQSDDDCGEGSRCAGARDNPTWCGSDDNGDCSCFGPAAVGHCQSRCMPLGSTYHKMDCGKDI
jgi:hypothetical protein